MGQVNSPLSSQSMCCSSGSCESGGEHPAEAGDDGADRGGCLVRRWGLDSARRWSAPPFRTTASSERSEEAEWVSSIWPWTNA
jgi:hypothetical protein